MSQIKVKHFGVILLHYITFCAALYFTTCKGHLSSLIYHVWQHGQTHVKPQIKYVISRWLFRADLRNNQPDVFETVKNDIFFPQRILYNTFILFYACLAK